MLLRFSVFKALSQVPPKQITLRSLWVPPLPCKNPLRDPSLPASHPRPSFPTARTSAAAWMSPNGLPAPCTITLGDLLATHTLPWQGPENKDDELCFCIPDMLWLPFPRQQITLRGSHSPSPITAFLSSIPAQLLARGDLSNPTSSQLRPRSRSCPTSGCKFPPRAEGTLQ